MKDVWLDRLREQKAKDGATPKELETARRFSDYWAMYERGDGLLPTADGRWTKAETDILKDMRRDHIHPLIISICLGRKTLSVVNKIESLSDYFRDCNEADHFEGPQSLPPGLEQLLLRSRLQVIWEGLVESKMTSKWNKVLMTQESTQWQTMIAETFPQRLVSILASIQPPHLARLESLPWSDTSSAGVFAWILKPKKGSFHFDNECYVYIGSATRYGMGLRDRKAGLQSRDGDNDSIMNPINFHRLDRGGKFVTLLEIPFANDSVEEITRVRTLAALAKVVLAIWLGAVAKGSRKAITGLVPWNIDTISYLGFAGHNSLSFNIRVPKPQGEEEGSAALGDRLHMERS